MDTWGVSDKASVYKQGWLSPILKSCAPVNETMKLVAGRVSKRNYRYDFVAKPQWKPLVCVGEVRLCHAQPALESQFPEAPMYLGREAP